MLITWIINVAVKVAVAVVAGAEAASMASGLVSLVFLLPSLAVSARRLHDIDKSGWFMLIPFYNLYLFAQPGDVGKNRFGGPSK